MTAFTSDNCNKPRASAAIIASVLVPIAVVFVGAFYSVEMKNSENGVKYVELAVSILRAEPAPDSAALRDWAVEVLKSQSVVPLTTEAQAQLRTHRLVYPTYDTGTTYPSGRLSR